tara:strand:+ start:281 stop:589 length:309 start_codon:yes stop_codon:yes gene_type:complete
LTASKQNLDAKKTLVKRFPDIIQEIDNQNAYLTISLPHKSLPNQSTYRERKEASIRIGIYSPSTNGRQGSPLGKPMGLGTTALQGNNCEVTPPQTLIQQSIK